MIMCSESKDIKCIELMLNYGANPMVHAFGNSALMYYIGGGSSSSPDVKGIQMLIDASLFPSEMVNYANDAGWTALHYAVKLDDKAVVKKLLDCTLLMFEFRIMCIDPSIDLFMKNLDGKTALDLAIEKDAKCMKLIQVFTNVFGERQIQRVKIKQLEKESYLNCMLSSKRKPKKRKKKKAPSAAKQNTSPPIEQPTPQTMSQVSESIEACMDSVDGSTQTGSSLEQEFYHIELEPQMELEPAMNTSLKTIDLKPNESPMQHHASMQQVVEHIAGIERPDQPIAFKNTQHSTLKDKGVVLNCKQASDADFNARIGYRIGKCYGRGILQLRPPPTEAISNIDPIYSDIPPILCFNPKLFRNYEKLRNYRIAGCTNGIVRVLPPVETSSDEEIDIKPIESSFEEDLQTLFPRLFDLDVSVGHFIGRNLEHASIAQLEELLHAHIEAMQQITIFIRSRQEDLHLQLEVESDLLNEQLET